ncbi:MAG: LysM peptidoglycan-binding domain-containing protein [Deltaproteobacteria bacterium]|nr:LysM peptidoglycan-binding domain-containing protein [Deltaproteobacteria bacterium]
MVPRPTRPALAVALALAALAACGGRPATTDGATATDGADDGAGATAGADAGDDDGARPDDADEPEDGDGAAGGGADAAADVPDVCVEHVVAEGETLWDIARSYGVGVRAIMAANGLRERQVRRLSKGRVLRIPGVTQAVPVLGAAARAAQLRASLPPLTNAAYHFLAPGETLWDVARTYGRTVDELVARNEFTDDDIRGLAVGRPVIVPGITDDQVRQAEPSERVGLVHVMGRGETIWDLARAFQVGVGQIMSANALSADEARLLREGTELFIPGVSEDRSGRVRRETTGVERSATAQARRLGLGTPQCARDLLNGRVKRSWIQAAGETDRLPGTLRWPVAKGWYVRGWGSGEGGYHLATDIMGEMGWNVRAAAAGLVAYSGNEVRGYGNMVIVIHPGGWVTTYAHNSVNFVVAGQRVPAGGILAELGSTGISRGPHVHFEFIFRGQLCDAELLFRPGVRHRNGRIESLRYVTWTDPDDRPASIRCAARRHHPRSRWVENETPEDEPASEAGGADAPPDEAGESAEPAGTPPPEPAPGP